MKPYKPSNIAPTEGIKILLVVSILAGLVTGAVTAGITQLIYLFFLFPLVMGGAGGTAVAWGIKKGKVRNPIIGGVFAAATGLFIYAAMNYANYLFFRQEISKAIVNEIRTSTSNEPEQVDNIDQIIDKFIKDYSGESGFLGYLKFLANQGVKLTRGSSKIEFAGENAAYINWSLEIFIIESTAIWLAVKAANRPFCEEANDWYGEEKLRGTATLDSQENLLNLLKSDDFSRAGVLVSQKDLPLPRLDIFLQEPPESNPAAKFSDSILVVKKTYLNSKKQAEFKNIICGQICQRDKVEFLRNAELPEISEPQTEEPKMEEFDI